MVTSETNVTGNFYKNNEIDVFAYQRTAEIFLRLVTLQKVL